MQQRSCAKLHHDTINIIIIIIEILVAFTDNPSPSQATWSPGDVWRLFIAACTTKGTGVVSGWLTQHTRQHTCSMSAKPWMPFWLINAQVSLNLTFWTKALPSSLNIRLLSSESLQHHTYIHHNTHHCTQHSAWLTATLTQWPKSRLTVSWQATTKQ